MTILTRAEVANAKWLHHIQPEMFTATTLAQMYAITPGAIYSVLTGRNWPDVLPEFTIPVQRANRERARAIIADLRAGLSQQEITARHGCSQSLVSMINSRQRWAELWEE